MRHELGLFRTWAVMARNVWGARELIWQLFKRDLLAGYKKSFIGMAWLFISPLMGIVSWRLFYVRDETVDMVLF
jgi:ABC-type polysaccharide/polyol phosphate export permease